MKLESRMLNPVRPLRAVGRIIRELSLIKPLLTVVNELDESWQTSTKSIMRTG
jgi:hypothetical protein